MKIKRESLVGDYVTDALLYLMEEKDYNGISITEICEKAGVTRVSFYRHFKSKEDVLKQRVTDITDSFLAVSGISYKNESTEVYFTKLFTHLKKQKAIGLALYKADLIHIVKEQFDRVFLQIHKDEYDDYKSYFLAGGIYNVFLFWLKNGCRESPSEMAERMESILVK